MYVNMTMKDREKGNVAAGLLCFVVVIAMIFTGFYFLSLWSDRSLEYVLGEIKERPVEVHGGLSFLFTLLAPVALLFNVIVEIYRSC